MIWDRILDKRTVKIPAFGIQHPMHVLTAYYGEGTAIKTGLAEKVIFYIDHPYDFQTRGTARMDIAGILSACKAEK